MGCNDGTVKSFTIIKSVDEVELLPNTTLWPDDDRISCDAIQWNSKVQQLLINLVIVLFEVFENYKQKQLRDV